MRDTFPGTLTFEWVNSGGFYNGHYQRNKGRCTLNLYAFPVKKGFLKDLLKKITPLDWEHERDNLTVLAEFLEYNVDRMKKEKVEYETTFDAKTEEITKRIETVKAVKQELTDCKAKGKEIDRKISDYQENLRLVRERLEVVS